MNTLYTLEDFFQRDPNSMEPDSQSAQISSDNASYRDYEADIFNFSLPGHSGQFFYDQALNQFVQTSYSNLKIETKYDTNRITGFVITDTRGIKYHFGTSSDGSRTGLERIVSAQTVSLTGAGFISGDPAVYGSVSEPYFQSWMLLDIEFPVSDKTISFEYTTEQQVKTTQLQNEEFINSHCNNPEYNVNYLYKEFTQPKIASIVFPDGKITFEKGNTARLDLHNSFPLEKIKLFNNQNELIKAVELHTSYFTSQLSVNSAFDYQGEGIYRLKLDSISQFDQNDKLLPPYKFTYNVKVLPDRYAKSQDYFGYYNGKNNTTLIPRAKYGLPGYIGDAERWVDPDFTDACMLEKIVYPTGGYDEFVWENNKISFFTGNAEDYVDHLVYDITYLTNDLYLFSDPDPGIDFSTTFTISPDSDGKVDFDISMTGCTSPDNLNDLSCDFSLSIIGITDPAFLLGISIPEFEYTFPAGQYKVIANSNDPGSNGENDEMNDPEAPGNPPGPGLPQMFGVSIDGPGQLATSRNFSYNAFAPQNTNLSSGMALNFPDLSMNNYKNGSCGLNPIAVVKVTSNSRAQLMPTKGSLTGYKNVTESYSGSGGNGRKEYTFSPVNSRADNPYQGMSYYDSPFPPNFMTPVYSDWLSGNLERLDYFDASDTLLKTEIYEYETVNTHHAQYFGIQRLRMNPVLDQEQILDNMYIAPYSYSTEWHRLKKTTTTDYFDTGQAAAVQDLIYDHNPLLVSQAKITTSLGETYITKTYYPEEAGEISGLQPLEITAVTELDALHQHRIAEPIQVETYKIDELDNEQLISTLRTLYKDWGAGLILPETIAASKDGEPLKDRIVFRDYEQNGNPLEVSKADGTPISYIWGYHRTKPIAKLEGISYADIDPATIADLQLLSDNDIDALSQQSLRDALNLLRDSYPDAVITTFTYDPLIGVTSITDTRGYVSFYNYDNFNRLESIKDSDGNSIEEFNYNYTRENNPEQ